MTSADLDGQTRTLEQLVDCGQATEATEALLALQSGGVVDASIHRRLADLCEALGLSERLVLELNLAFRDDPDDVQILRRLGHVHADGGRTERAIKCWRTVVERVPTDVTAWDELIALLLDLSRAEDARAAMERAFEATRDERFRARLRGIL